MGITDCTPSSKGRTDLKEMTTKGFTDGEAHVNTKRRQRRRLSYERKGAQMN